MFCDESVSNKEVMQEAIGIDLGLTHFATIFNGKKDSVLKYVQKKSVNFSQITTPFCKKKGLSNPAKAYLKMARLQARITDSRKDFLHELSTQLISENQTIVIETLAISNMQKNRCLSKSIADAGWYEFVRHIWIQVAFVWTSACWYR
ncbi:RNA-guided endonuclease InsQ/TnpB family protein [Nitrosococcus oceani]|uniref:RNA-guided endonuclease InsQ/TnpB family protein n=1 Tax=Nitrosococcus oceani TaxID=1229 RepID=UPI000183C361|nr:transposase [Nitrosococcus oceani]EDZ67849.1 hypothetical protein NOC27_1176 [Nitrosococcus oceani AFC27]GEM18750.1 hypothetical protein NONS58_01090 [Nitrosococcus oceani]